MKLIKLTLIACISFVINIKGYSQTITADAKNPVTTQKYCSYSFTGGTGINFQYWLPPSNSIPINSYGAPDWGKINGVILPLIWKNVEASSETSTLQVQYQDNLYNTHYATLPIGPFNLSFPTVSFVGGGNKNIPCYATSVVTIAVNNYINTVDNGYDKGEIITSHFEWTLPSGWHTTVGETGTFVSSSSISVIPPTSTSTASVSVKAKANTQYSAAATLQITRNLEAFTISGSSTVLCNSSNRYTASIAASGVTYTWQLPTGWTGTSTANYIDVIAKGAW